MILTLKSDNMILLFTIYNRKNIMNNFWNKLKKKWNTYDNMVYLHISDILISIIVIEIL